MSATYCIHLLDNFSAGMSVVATMTNLGDVSPLIALMVLKSTIMWKVFTSTTVRSMISSLVCLGCWMYHCERNLLSPWMFLHVAYLFACGSFN